MWLSILSISSNSGLKTPVSSVNTTGNSDNGFSSDTLPALSSTINWALISPSVKEDKSAGTTE